MRKVLHIISTLNEGGAEAFLHRLCSQSTNVKHSIVSLKCLGKYGPLLLKNNIQVYPLNISNFFNFFISIFKLTYILNKEKPNIVQTWLYHADFIGGLFSKLLGYSNIIWCIRHSDLDERITKKRTLIIFNLLIHLSNYIPKLIVFNSRSGYYHHLNKGYNSSISIQIPNGYNTSIYSPSLDKINNGSKPFTLGCVGRYHPQKDHFTLFKAISLIPDKSDYKFVFYGTGIEKSNIDLMTHIKNLELSDYVFLMGSSNDIPRVMNELDVLVSSSSHGEAFPNVVAEAMLCGTPCIVTDVGDSALLVNDCGWVVQPRNPSELMQAIVCSKNEFDSFQLFERGLKSRSKISNEYSIGDVSIMYQEIWHKIINYNAK